MLTNATESSFCAFFKWGRVGAKNPQHSLATFPSFQACLKVFAKKFRDKTGNAWDNRSGGSWQ